MIGIRNCFERIKMKKYISLEDKLTKLEVPCFRIVDITDESKISKFTEMLLNKETLPTNISSELWEIRNLDKIDYCKTKLREKTSLPENVIAKEFSASNGVLFHKFYYSNRFTFKEKEYLEEEEVDLNIQLKQTEHLASIASSLSFFVVLAWIGIVAFVIAIIATLINANS